MVLRDVEIVPEKGPALKLNNVRDFRTEGFACPGGLKCALEVTGSRNSNIVVEAPQIDAGNARIVPVSASAVTLL